jgi:hypothetical protein
MKSSWDYTRERSSYHFDPKRKDSADTAFTHLGYIEPTWTTDLEDIIANSRPATWATRGYKGEGVHIPSQDLEAEEYDIERVGADPKMIITHLNWSIPETLKQITESFALDDCMERIHVQHPGEVWNLHIDKLQKWAPDDPSLVGRYFIQLTDWQPGQFWEYGNYHWNQWRAGDVSTFDWPNMPHSTANAGHHPRVTFQLTGVITEKTRDFLRTL